MPIMSAYDHGQFSWVDLLAHDANAAKEFYSSFFGWHAVDQDTQGGPPYTIFQFNGNDVAGMGQMSDEMKSKGVPPIWNSYINVNDLETVAEKVSELGGQVTMSPMKVVDAGWMAFIQDPAGANVALWQKNQHIGATQINDPGCFCWNELATRDIEKAKDFYGRLLEWEFQENTDSPSKYYIVKNRGNDNGGIIQMNEQWGDMPPCWCVYFTVEKADAAVERLEQLGGKAMVPAFDIPIGRIAVASDPHGGVFSLFEFGLQPTE